MNIFFLGAIALVAYIVQTFLGLKQIKNFNMVYGRMRRRGRWLSADDRERLLQGHFFCLL